MAIARVQAVNNFSGTSPVTKAVTTTAGNSIILCIRSDHAITTVGNGGADTFTDVADTAVLFGNVFQSIWWVPACVGGAHTVSITSTGSTGMDLGVFEYSGGLATVDVAGKPATANGTAIASQSFTTATSATELMIGHIAPFGTFSAGTGGWTANGGTYGFGTAVIDQITSSVFTGQATATQTSNNWQILVATFAPAASAKSDIIPMIGGGKRVVDHPMLRMDERVRRDEDGARRYLRRQRGAEERGQPLWA